MSEGGAVGRWIGVNNHNGHRCQGINEGVHTSVSPASPVSQCHRASDVAAGVVSAEGCARAILRRSSERSPQRAGSRRWATLGRREVDSGVVMRPVNEQAQRARKVV